MAHAVIVEGAAVAQSVEELVKPLKYQHRAEGEAEEDAQELEGGPIERIRILINVRGGGTVAAGTYL